MRSVVKGGLQAPPEGWKPCLGYTPAFFQTWTLNAPPQTLLLNQWTISQRTPQASVKPELYQPITVLAGTTGLHLSTGCLLLEGRGLYLHPLERLFKVSVQLLPLIVGCSNLIPAFTPGSEPQAGHTREMHFQQKGPLT